MPHDQVELALEEMAGQLERAWASNPCTTCPLAELAALAAATLTFYRENRCIPRAEDMPHWMTFMDNGA